MVPVFDRRKLRPLILALAIALCAFQLTTCTGMWLLDPLIVRATHVGLVLSMLFLWRSSNRALRKNPRPEPAWSFLFDILMIAMSAGAAAYIITNFSYIQDRMPHIDELTAWDLFWGAGLIIAILEATRRVAGLALVIVSGIALLYAFFGHLLPGSMGHLYLAPNQIIESLYLLNDGIWGSSIGASATIIYVFILFGALLEKTNMASVFLELACLVTRNAKGGPAKAAIFGSALFGSVSGSAAANVYATGTFTIPMMKKTGYKPEFAGAVEAAASTGGQIMPPIMGTGAFILAETVGVPYSDVCFVSIIPAILFYIAIYFLVDLIARKRNLHGLPASDIRPLKQTMHAGGVFFIPILILVVLLVLGYTPFLSGVGCALLILLIGQIRKDTRVSAKKIVFALEDCAKSLMSIGGVIFCASLIVSMINITGLMMKTSAIILSFSQGKLWLTLLLVALIAYILGMGLPISTSYIILATLSAPAIVSLGVDMLVVHLTIFWFTQLATITPPVCMTAFAAAGIAQGQPMKTGFTALKMGFTFYYVPVLFVYSQLINGAWWVQCIIAVFAIIAIYFLGTFTEKYFMGDLGNIQRFTGLAIFAVIYFMMFDGLTMPMRGALLALAVALIASLYIVQKKKQQAAA